MVGTAPALSLVLPFLVLTNGSASKCAYIVTQVYFSHTTMQFCLPIYTSHSGWMHSIKEHLDMYALITYLEGNQQHEKTIQIHITAETDATCHTLFNTSSCWWSQLMKFLNLSWGAKTTPHLPRRSAQEPQGNSMSMCESALHVLRPHPHTESQLHIFNKTNIKHIFCCCCKL